MLRLSLQFFGGSGARIGRVARTGAANAAALEAARESTRAKLSSMKAPTFQESRTISFNGMTAHVNKVRPGYARASGENRTMFSINITNAAGENIFRTNRYGSSAWKEIKDDIALHLGLR